MHVIVAAVGRAGDGPERELVARYIERAGKAGRALAFHPVELVELRESRAATTAERKRAEAGALLAAIPAASHIVALDEGGVDLASLPLATELARLRDGGAPACAFLIGGPDGHDPDLLRRANRRVAFGRATWPHLLVRAMLAEQLYRVCTILAGHPYHRV